MKALNYLPVAITISYAFGIIIGQTNPLWSKVIFDFKFILIGIVLSLILLNNHIKSFWAPALSTLSILSCGILSVYLANPLNNPSHYTRLNEFNPNKQQYIIFEPIKHLKPSAKFEKIIVKIKKVNNQDCSGKLLIYAPKTYFNYKTFEVRKLYLISSTLKAIPPPLNPNVFDYKTYMEQQEIYHSTTLNSNQNITAIGTINNLSQYGSHLRVIVNKRLDNSNLNKDSKAIIQAMLLGQRQNIDRKVYSNYINSGAVHLLAVSGLHVGIITLILGWLLSPFKYLKYGATFSKVTIIILIWFYAITTGASVSVCRAATMFSFLILGTLLKRPTKPINNLAVSALVLLIVKPNFIYDVGFQLSYLAVLGILIIHPILNKVIHPKNKLVSYFWSLITVSLGAQIGVFPLTIFYFKQFPILFLVTNIMLLPVISVFIGLSLLTIILSGMKNIDHLLETGVDVINQYISIVVSWIGTKDNLIVRNIQTDVYDTVLIYGIICSIIIYFKSKTSKSIIITCFLCLSLQFKTIYNKFWNTKKELVVFHQFKNSILTTNKNNMLEIACKQEFDTLPYSISNYVSINNSHNISKVPMSHYYKLKDALLLVIKSNNLYLETHKKADVILLSGSPKINLERLIGIHKPKLIISDGSNYKSFIKRWSKTCKKTKTPFHNTYEKGARIFKL